MHDDTNTPNTPARQKLQRSPGNDAYARVTERIIQALEAGTVPWTQCWKGGVAPQNLITRRPYTGINAFLLTLAEHESPYFLTFKQARDLGGHVRKGEHGYHVIYASRFTRTLEDEETGEKETKNFRFLRTYTVFNAEQCEGIEVPKPEYLSNPFTPIEECERIVAGYQSGPSIVHRDQAAYYLPTTDTVNMPRPESFTPPDAYYATLFHELVHSTGHASRLNREGVASFHRFGDPVYTKEELIAEMGAAFLSNHAGIEPRTFDNSAAYIASWLGSLRKDSRLVIFAASAAQRAADHILGLTPGYGPERGGGLGDVGSREERLYADVSS